MSEVSEVVTGGDLRASLIAIRDRLAAELSPTEHEGDCYCQCGPPPADGRDVAVLAKELRAVLVQIDALPGSQEVSRLDRIAGGVGDELARRRADRGAGRPHPSGA